MIKSLGKGGMAGAVCADFVIPAFRFFFVAGVMGAVFVGKNLKKLFEKS